MARAKQVKLPVDIFYEWYEELLKRNAASPSISATFKDERMKAVLLAAFLKGLEASQYLCQDQQP